MRYLYDDKTGFMQQNAPTSLMAQWTLQLLLLCKVLLLQHLSVSSVSTGGGCAPK